MYERSRLSQFMEVLGPASGMVASALAVFLVVPLLRNAAAESEAALPRIVQAFLEHGVAFAIGALVLGTVSIVIIRMSPRRWIGWTCSIVCTLAIFVPLMMFIVGFWAFYVAMLDSAGEL